METVLQMILEVGEARLFVVILAALLEWSQIILSLAPQSGCAGVG